MSAPSSSTVDRLAELLGADQVATGGALDARHLRDWVVPLTEGSPLALVRPRSTAEVSAVLRTCHEQRTIVVPQGGLTGLVGGATPIANCVLLSLDRMAGIEEIDEAAATMTVLAGTPLQAVQEAASKAGFFFPLDLGARGSCQVGGVIATNAGGNRVIRYGMTRDLVLGLEVVLADGTVLTALNKLIKNNAAFDLKQLFVGSEGTLGVVTRAVLRLHPRPLSQSTAFCAVDHFDHVVALLRHARESLGGSLSAFEMMWPDFYDLTSVVPGMPRPLPSGSGGYVLIESLGGNQDEDQVRFERMLASAASAGLIVDAVVAQSAVEARSFWQVRDASGEFQRMLGGPNVGFDLGIPTRDIGRFVEACRAALERRWPGMRAAFFGHIGDSNLHLHVKVREGDQPGHEIDAVVYGLVREWGGTISAEHGIGLLKKPYLGYTRSSAQIAVMRAIKKALDPAGILNPGKVFDGA